MVRDVVPEGVPPPVCCWNSHHEKVSGRTAVPPLGPPQPTVAVADTAVDLNPSTGANQCLTGVWPVTVTLSGTVLSVGCDAVPVPSLASMRHGAVDSMLPPLPRAQS